MNGPEHYREAERLLSLGPGVLAAAQVHATLALAAATIEAASASIYREVAPAWTEATR